MEKVKILPETIPKVEATLLCSTFLEAVQAFYEDPAHIAAFEKWQNSRAKEMTTS